MSLIVSSIYIIADLYNAANKVRTCFSAEGELFWTAAIFVMFPHSFCVIVSSAVCVCVGVCVGVGVGVCVCVCLYLGQVTFTVGGI